MANKKPYVIIHSELDIVVTAGLQHVDVTNKDAHVPDRLKVNPLWPKLKVLIKKGQGVYPAEIVEWGSVKALVSTKKLTIGEYIENAETVEQMQIREQLLNNTKEAEVKMTATKKQTLNEIAGE